MDLRQLGVLAFVAIACVSGLDGCKYDPHPKDGNLSCGPADECPQGYLCVQGTCWSNRNSGPATPLGCDKKTAFTANEQVVRSCILRVGCNPFGPSRSISTCVTFNTQDALAGERCNLPSNTCADYQRCEGIGIAGDDLCLNHIGGRCMGSKAINCSRSDTSYVVDCAKVNGSCHVSGIGSNAVAACAVVPACGETDAPNTHCKGNFSYVCDQGVGDGISCGSQSFCNPQDGMCYFSGSACAGDSDVCSGQAELVCTSGQQFRYDCSSVGLRCASAAVDPTWCLAPGCTVADTESSNCAETCNGSMLTFCYGGVPYTVDCRNYGFATCQDGLTSQSFLTGDPTYATCSN